MKTAIHDLVIVGAGMAGLAAARHAARAGLAPLLIEGLSFGGLVTNVNELDGEVTGMGAEVATDMMMQACDLGAQVLTENVAGIETQDGNFVVITDQGRHPAGAVIAASGAVLRTLGVPGEDEFAGRGVSHCADCDGGFFRGRDVVVVGGGDAALQAALLLAQTSRTVNLVHRRDRYSARPEYVERVAAHPRIERLLDARVTAIVGGATVEAVEVERGGATTRLACAGVFPLVGLRPAGDYLPDPVRRDDGGHVLVDREMATGLPGVFAAGALRAGYGGQVADAIADGERAAASAAEWLRRQEASEAG